MPKYIAVELTERELEILQTAMHNLNDSILMESPTHDLDIEVHDLESRIDNIYAEFDLIPDSSENIVLQDFILEFSPIHTKEDLKNLSYEALWDIVDEINKVRKEV